MILYLQPGHKRPLSCHWRTLLALTQLLGSARWLLLSCHTAQTVCRVVVECNLLGSGPHTQSYAPPARPRKESSSTNSKWGWGLFTFWNGKLGSNQEQWASQFQTEHYTGVNSIQQTISYNALIYSLNEQTKYLLFSFVVSCCMQLCSCIFFFFFSAIVGFSWWVFGCGEVADVWGVGGFVMCSVDQLLLELISYRTDVHH